MPYMVFQSGWEPVLMQRIINGLETIWKNKLISNDSKMSNTMISIKVTTISNIMNVTNFASGFFLF